MNGWISLWVLGALVGCLTAAGSTAQAAGSTPVKGKTPTAHVAVKTTSPLPATVRTTSGSSPLVNVKTTSPSPVTVRTTSPQSTTSTTTTPNPEANKTVCYDVVGCFDNYPPFNNAALDLPVSPEVIQTGFWLYTRENNDFELQDELNYTDPTSISQSRFDPSKLTKILIHGFNNNGNTSWVQRFRGELLRKGDWNVVVVDWGRGAYFPDYAQAVANTRLVGTQVKLLIDLLVKAGLHLEDLHLLGHSLGAHTSGYAGRLLGGKVSRISGFDPADPSFKDEPLIVRLDKGDAIFVDVTHTNTGLLGIDTPSGHVDFYMNGGANQPGCPSGVLSGAFGSLFGGDDNQGLGCSHGRSYDVFMESMFTTCPFTAYPCSSYDTFQKGKCLTCGTQGCTQYGYYSDQYHARGSFYLNTAANTPFCGYHYGVDLTAPSSAKETKGKLYISLTGEWGTTGFVQITGDDSLKPGGRITKVILAPREVGDITAASVKYVKHSGFWFSKGEDSFALDRIQVTSGENGSKYLMCIRGQKLPHNTPVRAAMTTRSTC